MDEITNLLRDQFPEHTNFQPDALGEEATILCKFREKWSEVWNSNRAYMRAERGGGLVLSLIHI